MKAISLWQPHPLAISLGLKPWETRDWPTRYRGPLAIHAARRPWNDAGEWHAAAAMCLGLRIQTVVREAYPALRDDAFKDACLHLKDKWMAFGAVVCTVDLVDCVRTSELRGKIPPAHEFWGDFSDGKTGKGRFAFKLENVRPLPQPIPCRGMQGFFEVDLGEYDRAPEPAMRSLFEGAR